MQQLLMAFGTLRNCNCNWNWQLIALSSYHFHLQKLSTVNITTNTSTIKILGRCFPRFRLSQSSRESRPSPMAALPGPGTLGELSRPPSPHARVSGVPAGAMPPSSPSECSLCSALLEHGRPWRAPSHASTILYITSHSHSHSATPLTQSHAPSRVPQERSASAERGVGGARAPTTEKQVSGKSRTCLLLFLFIG